MKNLKIGTRLTLGFGILLAFMMIVGLYGIIVMRDFKEQIQKIVEQDMVETDQAHQIINNVNIIARGLRNIVLNLDKKFQDDELKRIADSRKKAGEMFETLSKSIIEGKGAALVKEGAILRSAYVNASENYMGLVKDGQIDDAKKMLFAEVRETQGKYFEGLEALIEYKSNESQKEGQRMAEEANRGSMIIVSILDGIAGSGNTYGISYRAVYHWTGAQNIRAG